MPLAIRLVLAAIFLIAGTAKIADLRGSVQTLGDFGVPRFLQPLGVLLPPVEIAVAAGLLFTRTAHDAAWGALALLLVFVAGVAVNLARGRQPDCHCFGQIRVRPIGRWTLVRNGVLAAAAAWLVAARHDRAPVNLWAFLAGLDSTGRRIATVIGAVVVFAMLSALKRKPPPEEEQEEEPDPDWEPIDDAPAPRARPMPAAPAPAQTPARVLTGDGLPIGTVAPAFVLPDPEGRTHSLDELRASGKAVLLVFSSPHCSACRTLAPALPALAATHASTTRMVVVTREGARGEPRDGDGGPLVLLQRETEISEAYDCGTIPAAVLVDADGVIRSRLAVGMPEIERLLASGSDSAERPPS